MLKVEMLLVRALEIAFFAGLAGCAATVVSSWISIFGGELKKEEKLSTRDPIEPSHSHRSNFFHSELRRQEELGGSIRR